MKTKILTLLSALALFTTSSKAISIVGVELALLVDVSSSISASEYGLQKDGYEAAFRNAAFQQLIANTPGGVAVSYIEFGTNQSTRIDWQILKSAADAEDFADDINALTRLMSGIGGLTEIAGAIDFATQSILNNKDDEDMDIIGVRKVIDVSGDGKDNREPVEGGFKVLEKGDDDGFAATGQKTADAAQNALDAGITQINGLPIVTDEVDDEGLEAWYTQWVLAGPDAFVIPATDFNELGNIILTKLTREVEEPEPEGVPDSGTTAALLGFGLMALAAIRRRAKF